MKVLVDMNLAPAWCEVLTVEGWEALHWSTVGDPRAADAAIMAWARANGFVVFTHDLDSGTLLALTHASGPSVIQLRVQDVLPASLSASVVAALRRFSAELQAGALVVIDTETARARLLPIAR